jgi:hypothetical protein
MCAVKEPAAILLPQTPEDMERNEFVAMASKLAFSPIVVDSPISDDYPTILNPPFTPSGDVSVTSSIDETLKQRGNRYGEFKGHAAIAQGIKRAMQNSRNWETLSDDKKEALEMLAHKVGRILNGDPEYHDSWHDIIGYTKLVEDTLTA